MPSDGAAAPSPRSRTRLDLRPELLLAIATALAIIVLRSIVPMVYERYDFNSDQAIVGLMAKHLSELRTFPLFYYGQNYMLGVESWIAAPFVLAGGTTIAMMRLPLIMIGAAAALVCMFVFVRRGMRPLAALVATLPIVATTPIVSATMLELGASVEPFLYVGCCGGSAAVPMRSAPCCASRFCTASSRCSPRPRSRWCSGVTGPGRGPLPPGPQRRSPPSGCSSIC